MNDCTIYYMSYLDRFKRTQDIMTANKPDCYRNVSGKEYSKYKGLCLITRKFDIFETMIDQGYNINLISVPMSRSQFIRVLSEDKYKCVQEIHLVDSSWESKSLITVPPSITHLKIHGTVNLDISGSTKVTIHTPLPNN